MRPPAVRKTFLPGRVLLSGAALPLRIRDPVWVLFKERAAHDIKLLLAGQVFSFHFVKAFVIPQGILLADVHNRTVIVKPFPPV